MLKYLVAIFSGNESASEYNLKCTTRFAQCQCHLHSYTTGVYMDMNPNAAVSFTPPWNLNILGFHYGSSSAGQLCDWLSTAHVALWFLSWSLFCHTCIGLGTFWFHFPERSTKLLNQLCHFLEPVILEKAHHGPESLVGFTMNIGGHATAMNSGVPTGIAKTFVHGVAGMSLCGCDIGDLETSNINMIPFTTLVLIAWSLALGGYTWYWLRQPVRPVIFPPTTLVTHATVPKTSGQWGFADWREIAGCPEEDQWTSRACTAKRQHWARHETHAEANMVAELCGSLHQLQPQERLRMVEVISDIFRHLQSQWGRRVPAAWPRRKWETETSSAGGQVRDVFKDLLNVAAGFCSGYLQCSQPITQNTLSGQVLVRLVWILLCNNFL